MYLPEPGSDDLNRIVEGRLDLIVSDLAVTEIVSALARRRREGALTLEVARQVQHAILDGIAGGVFQYLELTRDVHRRAEQYLLGATGTLRAADALHLALATTARARSLASFDVRLRAAARETGLAIYPA